MNYRVVAAAAAFLVAGGAAHATQFIVNGDFTQLSNGLGQINYNTVATGWSVANNGYDFVMTVGDLGAPGQYGNTALWDAANGGNNTWNGTTLSGLGNFAALDGDFQTEALTQTMTNLTIGETYTLSFNYAFGQQSGFPQSVTESLTASIDSFSVTLPSAFSGCDGSGNNCTGGYLNPEHGFSGWSTYSTTFVADATTETLSFLAAGSKQEPPFALISDVSLTGSAPEPSTWAMMLIGFGGLGFAAYRRRRKLDVAAAV